MQLCSVLDRWRCFLTNNHFTILLDHSALSYLQNEKLFDNPRLRRWQMLLAQFRFSIAYKEGQENGLADTLSRFPMDNVAFIFAGISTNNGEKYEMDEI